MDARLNPLFEQRAPAQSCLTNPNQTPRYRHSTSHLNTHRLCSRNKQDKTAHLNLEMVQRCGSSTLPVPSPANWKDGMLEAQCRMSLLVYLLNYMQEACAQVCVRKSLPQAQGLQQNKPVTQAELKRPLRAD